MRFDIKNGLFSHLNFFILLLAVYSTSCELICQDTLCEGWKLHNAQMSIKKNLFQENITSLFYPPHEIGNSVPFLQLTRTSNASEIQLSLSLNYTQLKKKTCLSTHLFATTGLSSNLNLIFIKKDQSNELWSQNNFIKDAWQPLEIQMPEHWYDNDVLVFQATHPFMAIADITFKEGECSLNSLCTFEPYENCWIRLENPMPQTYNFIKVQGAQENVHYNDHTRGNELGYMLRAKGTPLGSRKTASLVLLPATDEIRVSCLRFWILKLKSTEDPLEVIAVPEEHFKSSNQSTQHLNLLWSSSNYPSTNDWQFIQVPIRLRINDTLYLLSQQQTNSGSSHLDDLRIDDEECSNTVHSCDFTDSLCFLTSNTKMQNSFIIGHGRTKSNWILKPPVRFINGISQPFAYVDLNNNASLAVLESPIFPASNIGSCLTVSYQLNPIQNINILDAIKNEVVQISQIDIDSKLERTVKSLKTYSLKNEWQKEQVLIISHNNFRLRLQVNASSSILFSMSEFTYEENTNCLNTDRINQIGKEIESFSCSFEGNTAKWTNECFQSFYKKTDFSKDRSFYDVLPFEDATGKLGKNYIFYHTYIMKDSPMTASLKSPVYYQSQDHRLELPYGHLFCFHFFYFIKKIYKDTNIKVYLNNGELLFETRSASLHRHWHQRMITFFSRDNFQIIVQTEIVRSTVAFDEFKLYLGACEDIDENQECDFETGRCGWNIPKATQLNQLMFQRKKGYELGTIDHDFGSLLGHFMAVQIPVNYNNNGHTSIVHKLRTLNLSNEPVNTICLRFWYNMAANNLKFEIATLAEDVDLLDELNDLVEFEMYGYEAQDSWYPAKVELKLREDSEQIIIRLNYSNATHGFFGLDSIKITKGECPATECSFETTNCDWHSINNIKSITYIEKLLGNPVNVLNEGSLDIVQASNYDPKRPIKDHTLQSTQGYYTYAFLNHFALLRSSRIPVIETQEKYCVSMWLFGASIEKPALIQLLASYNNHSQLYEMAHTNFYSKEWTNLRFTVNLRLFKEFKNLQHDNNYLVLYLMTSNASSTQNIKTNSILKEQISLDDLQTHEGSCEPVNLEFHCIGSNQKVSINQVCDFYEDCENGADEKNCAKCDFQKDQCEYKNMVKTITNQKNWKIVNGLDLSKKFDLTNDLIQDYIFNYTNSEIQYDPQAMTSHSDLVSPILREASSECTLNFVFASTNINFQIIVETESTFTIWTNEGMDFPKALNMSIKIGRVRGEFRLHFQTYLNRLYKNEKNNVGNAILRHLSTEKCSLPRPQNQCESWEMRCKNNACVSLSNTCNYVDDCGDMSDEENCDYDLYSLDFERGTGFWDIEKSYYITNGLKNSKPTRDHSWNLREGNYLFFTKKSNDSNQAVITSPIIFNKDQCSIRLAYMAKGPFVSLELQFEETVLENAQLRSEQIQLINNALDWTFINFDLTSLPLRFPIKISIVSTINSENSFLAIDSVSFTKHCYDNQIVRMTLSPITKALHWDIWKIKYQALNILYKLSSDNYQVLHWINKFSLTHDKAYKIVKNNPKYAQDPYENADIIGDLIPLYKDYDNDDLGYDSDEEESQEQNSFIIESLPIRLANYTNGIYFGFRWASIGNIQGDIVVKQNLFINSYELSTEIANFKNTQASNNWEQVCMYIQKPEKQNFQQNQEMTDFSLILEMQMYDNDAIMSLDQIHLSTDISCFDDNLCTFDSPDECKYLHADRILAEDLDTKDHSFASEKGNVIWVKNLMYLKVPTHKKMCLRVWVNQLCSISNSNDLDVDSYEEKNMTSLFTLTNREKTLAKINSMPYLKTWFLAKIAFIAENEQDLVISSESNKNLIMDDISVTYEDCSQVDCSFDQDTCGWTSNTYTPSWQWFLVKANNFIYGPRLDAHNHSSSGYLVLKSKSATIEDAQLHSPLIFGMETNQKVHCLQFFYWSTPNSTVNIKVYARKMLYKKLFDTSVKGQGIWIKERVNIQMPSIGKTLQIKITGNVNSLIGNEQKLYILAIDSIQLIDESCNALDLQNEQTKRQEELENEYSEINRFNQTIENEVIVPENITTLKEDITTKSYDLIIDKLTTKAMNNNEKITEQIKETEDLLKTTQKPEDNLKDEQISYKKNESNLNFEQSTTKLVNERFLKQLPKQQVENHFSVNWLIKLTLTLFILGALISLVYFNFFPNHLKLFKSKKITEQQMLLKELRRTKSFSNQEISL